MPDGTFFDGEQIALSSLKYALQCSSRRFSVRSERGIVRSLRAWRHHLQDKWTQHIIKVDRISSKT
jgi:hypothetical protein